MKLISPNYSSTLRCVRHRSESAVSRALGIRVGAVEVQPDRVPLSPAPLAPSLGSNTQMNLLMQKYWTTLPGIFTTGDCVRFMEQAGAQAINDDLDVAVGQKLGRLAASGSVLIAGRLGKATLWRFA